MVTKNQIKRINGLHQKKNRQAEQLFIAEGQKVIGELLDAGFEVEDLFVTEPLFPTVSQEKITVISASDLKKISALTVPNNCLAVFRIPKPKPLKTSRLIVALDDVRDPGNLGTILRLCDWFGISDLICSAQTVDLYNPKVVQATMGSIARVNVTYGDLSALLTATPLPVFGTFMDGANIYQTELPKAGIIVMGNEANGICSALEKIIQNRLTIPRFGDLQQTESLNVATATAIVLSEFCRQG